jgi:hypothetical protein
MNLLVVDVPKSRKYWRHHHLPQDIHSHKPTGFADYQTAWGVIRVKSRAHPQEFSPNSYLALEVSHIGVKIMAHTQWVARSG